MLLRTRYRRVLQMRSAIVTLVCVAATGCGIADGGPIGTGIVASVSGNVVEVDEVLQVADEEVLDLANVLSVSDVTISIDEVPDLATTTDADGNFALEGDFAGSLTLRFQTKNVDATSNIDLPVGAAIVLSDIEIQDNEVHPAGVRTLNIIGTAVEIDCEAGEIKLRERKKNRRVTALLTTETVFENARNGREIECGGLVGGSEIGVGGTTELGTRIIIADTVWQNPPPGSRPPEFEVVHFHGTIINQNCARPGIRIQDRLAAFSLLFEETTAIFDLDDRPIRCEDLSIGDDVGGRGFIDLRKPAVTVAQLVREVPERGSEPGQPTPPVADGNAN